MDSDSVYAAALIHHEDIFNWTIQLNLVCVIFFILGIQVEPDHPVHL